MGALVEINTDGLAKLAEIVGTWTGLNARGRKKLADAEAYATVREVEAQSEAELARLRGEESVALFVYNREMRKMNNIHKIVEQAKTQFSEGEQVPPEPVNQDWQNRFFSIAEDISDEEMQRLWAQILAGEIKRPKSFSLRTLDTLRNITKEEAEIFIHASQFYLANNYICVEPFALELLQYLRLCDAGLMSYESLVKTWEIKKHDKELILYRKDLYLNLYNDTDRDIKVTVNVKRLTLAGEELLKLCASPEEDVFLPQLVKMVKKRGIRPTIMRFIQETQEFSLEVQL